MEALPFFTTLIMDELMALSAITREPLLPLTVRDTPLQSPAVSPLNTLIIEGFNGFASIIDIIDSIYMYSARAPRIPAIRRDYLLQGP
jgi:hypothetical protein